jgi:hypothetical protein
LAGKNENWLENMPPSFIIYFENPDQKYGQAFKKSIKMQSGAKMGFYRSATSTLILVSLTYVIVV